MLRWRSLLRRIRLESLKPLPFSPPQPSVSGAAADPAAEFLLAEARKRLRAALEGLDQALSRHNQLVLEQADQIAEYAALQEDRSRLARELDAATGRERLLEAANLEAARRIERASAAVRAMIAADIAAEPDAELPSESGLDSGSEPGLEPGADPARED
jgi:Domain of unknown function (DUF4164)